MFVQGLLAIVKADLAAIQVREGYWMAKMVAVELVKAIVGLACNYGGVGLWFLGQDKGGR